MLSFIKKVEKLRVIFINGWVNVFETNSGRFDFALESSGGTIVSTPSTETYEPTRAVISIWGIPIWQVKDSPRQIIESGDKYIPHQASVFIGFESKRFLVENKQFFT